MDRLRHLVRQPWFVMPVLAVVAFAGWYVLRSDGSSSNAAATPSSQVVQATSGTLSQTVSAQGTVAAASSSDLSFSSAGTVTAVNVTGGQTVKAGDVLATHELADARAERRRRGVHARRRASEARR